MKELLQLIVYFSFLRKAFYAEISENNNFKALLKMDDESDKKKVSCLAVAVCATVLKIPIVIITSAKSGFVVPVIPNTQKTTREIYIAYNETEDRIFHTVPNAQGKAMYTSFIRTSFFSVEARYS